MGCCSTTLRKYSCRSRCFSSSLMSASLRFRGADGCHRETLHARTACSLRVAEKHEEMDRMFADVFGQSTGGRQSSGGLMSSAPAIEVSERDNQIWICAELPVLKPEEVKVEGSCDALIIEGERKHEQEDRSEGRFHTERRYGRFHRAIPLPEGANLDQARAEFRNGELRVTVPVERPESRRQIPVSGSGGEQQKGEIGRRIPEAQVSSESQAAVTTTTKNQGGDAAVRRPR